MITVEIGTQTLPEQFKNASHSSSLVGHADLWVFLHGFCPNTFHHPLFHTV
jgi:hypothetical protein